MMTMTEMLMINLARMIKIRSWASNRPSKHLAQLSCWRPLQDVVLLEMQVFVG